MTRRLGPPEDTDAAAQTELRAAQSAMARLGDIVDAVGDAVFTTDADGVVASWNTGAERLLGYASSEVLGSDWAELHPAGSGAPSQLKEMLTDRESIRGFETVLRACDGELAEVSLDVTTLYDDARARDAFVFVARDIGDRRKLEAELVRQTMHDVLTGLPNRAYLTYRLTQALASARRHGDPVAVLVVDLDQFKAVDDVHGHQVGDKVLAELADRLRELAGPFDLVARLGGDEFVLVCPGVDVEASAGVAQRLLETISAPIHIGHRSLRVGASVGIAMLTSLGGTAETLLKQADVAVYEAKARGGSRSQVFDQQFARQAADRRRLAADLYSALTSGRLEVHYQPVLDLTTERMVGLEALARWQHPERGMVPPSTFIRLAETNNFVAELDAWVLERACQETAEALESERIPAGVRVAVNLSARSLDDPELADLVGVIVGRSGLAPGSLILEVTETALLESRDTARASIEALRALGAGVFLDDFGTGYSSLSFLRELPVTGVKIDRSFVCDVVDGPEDVAITEAIVRLGQGLGLETVAEGVETVEQRDLLRRLGCATAQGYLWSPAVPMTDLASDVELPADDAAEDAAGDAAQLLDTSRTDPSPTSGRGRGPRRRPEPVVDDSRPMACCLRGGLEDGQAWLVVTSASRRAALAQTLGPLHAAALAAGRLIELDAYEVLRKVTSADGGLDPARFKNVVGIPLRRLATASPDVGVHSELGHVKQPLLSLRVASELRQRLHDVSRLGLEDTARPADCASHGPVALATAGDSTAS